MLHLRYWLLTLVCVVAAWSLGFWVDRPSCTRDCGPPEKLGLYTQQRLVGIVERHGEGYRVHVVDKESVQVLKAYREAADE